MEIINCVQGTPEWHESRLGIVTASEMHTVMASGRGGGESLTRRKYMMRLASEIITGEPCVAFEGNADTERGHELEPIIRELYEARTGLPVEQVGFIRSGRVGCSPDGLVEADGGTEFKAKRPYIHLEVLLTGEVPPEHMKQIQTCLWVSERSWWDFACHSPGLPFFIKRVERDNELIAQIEDATNRFTDELDAVVERIKGMF